MKHRIVTCVTTITLFSAMATPMGVAAQDKGQPIFITFDPPGSVSTSPTGINPAGTIVGGYTDATGVLHGFLRTSDGAITTFDAPGAGTVPQMGQGTFAVGINPAGAIAGWYFDANNNGNGFVRAPDGAITTFDAPGCVGALPNGINPAGAIVGNGFLRAPDGSCTDFEANVGNITFANSINPAGMIAGYINVPGAPDPGFLRAPDGTITTFLPPGSVVSTIVGGNSINPAGTIAGWYVFGVPITHALNYGGFLRTRDGALTTFEAPGAGNGQSQGTGGNNMAINPAGAITGSYIDGSGTNHGFVRTPQGTFISFDPPGSVSTLPAAISPAGAVTGSYNDASGTSHGFLLLPF